MNISNFVLNWILNWIIFGPDSMFDWIIKTYQIGLVTTLICIKSFVCLAQPTSKFSGYKLKIVYQEKTMVRKGSANCSDPLFESLHHARINPTPRIALSVGSLVRPLVTKFQPTDWWWLCAGSHGLSARRVQRTKSRRTEGPQIRS